MSKKLKAAEEQLAEVHNEIQALKVKQNRLHARLVMLNDGTDLDTVAERNTIRETLKNIDDILPRNLNVITLSTAQGRIELEYIHSKQHLMDTIRELGTLKERRQDIENLAKRWTFNDVDVALGHLEALRVICRQNNVYWQTGITSDRDFVPMILRIKNIKRDLESLAFIEQRIAEYE